MTTTFAVVTAQVASVVFAGVPSSITAGTALPAFTVSFTDQYGNLVDTPASVQFANADNSSSGTISLTRTGLGVSTATQTVFTLTGNYTLSVPGLTVGNGVTVTGNVAFTVEANTNVASVTVQNLPATLTAGDNLPALTLEFKDAFMNPVDASAFAGSVQVLITPFGGGVPYLLTLEAMPQPQTNMLVTTALQVTTAGTYQLMIAGMPALTAVLPSMSVQAGAAASVEFIGVATSIVAGMNLPSFTVRYSDTLGNLTDFAIPNTNVMFSNGTSGSSVVVSSGTLTLARTSVGVYHSTATPFYGSSDYTLSIADITVTTGTTMFKVQPGAGFIATFSGTKPLLIANKPMSPFSLWLQDQFGNPTDKRVGNGTVQFARMGVPAPADTIPMTRLYTGIYLMDSSNVRFPIPGAYTLTVTGVSVGNTHGTQTFTVVSPPARPVIDSIVPPLVDVHTSSWAVMLHGMNFTPTSQVVNKGNVLASTFIDANTLSLTLPAPLRQTGVYIFHVRTATTPSDSSAPHPLGVVDSVAQSDAIVNVISDSIPTLTSAQQQAFDQLTASPFVDTARAVLMTDYMSIIQNRNVRFNLLPGVTVDGIVESIEQTDEESYAVTGYIPTGEPFMENFLISIDNRNHIRGHLHVGFTEYHIAPVDNSSLHAVTRVIYDSTFVFCNMPSGAPTPASAKSHADAPLLSRKMPSGTGTIATTCPPDPNSTVVTVLFLVEQHSVWENQAPAIQGNLNLKDQFVPLDKVDGVIQTDLDYTNMALKNSNVKMRYERTKTAPQIIQFDIADPLDHPPYPITDFPTPPTFDQVINLLYFQIAPPDNYPENAPRPIQTVLPYNWKIQRLREEHKADLVVILFHARYGGIVGLASGIGPMDKNNAFVLVTYPTFLGGIDRNPRVLAHELGHLLGGRHQFAEPGAMGIPDITLFDGHGFHLHIPASPGIEKADWYSIMCGAGSANTDYFAGHDTYPNPSLVKGSSPLFGDAGLHDVTRIISTNAPIISEYRSFPTATIVGPSFIRYGETATFTCNVQGIPADTPYKIRWFAWATNGKYYKVEESSYLKTCGKNTSNPFTATVPVIANPYTYSGMNVYAYIETATGERVNVFKEVFVYGDGSQTLRSSNSLFDEGLPMPVAGVNGSKPELPHSFELFQNAPNPFSDKTEITFLLPEPSHVTLALYDVLGREVLRPVDAAFKAGTHTTSIDARLLPAGVYSYRLSAGSNSLTRQLCILK